MVEHIGGELVKTDTAESGRDASETALDHLVGQPDRLEHLRPAIAIDRSDAHLGHDLEQPLLQRVDVVLLGLIGQFRLGMGERGGGLGFVPLAAHFVALDGQGAHRRQRQVGVDRLGAHADQAGQVMDLAWLAALDNQADIGAPADTDEMLVDRTEREQRRDRRVGLVHAAVTDDQDHLAGCDSLFGLATQPIERRDQRVGAFGGGEQGAQRCAGERRILQAPDHGEVLIVQHRAGQAQQMGVGWPLLQQMAAPAQHERQRHDQLLAQRIDRRVGDLGEALFEIVVQRARAVGEHCRRRIVAHRADRLLTVAQHGPQDDGQLLGGIAEGALQFAQQRRLRLARLARLGLVALAVVRGARRGQHVHLALEPRSVGRLGCQPALDRVVLLETAVLQVDSDHLAGADLALADDPGFIDRHGADLRATDHQAIVGHQVARRAQAVAVERQAGHLAIAERQRRRAIPRLDQAGVVLIKRAPGGVHIRHAFPGLGHQHGQRVADVASAQHQQLEHIIELGRVAAAHSDHRPEPGNLCCKGRAALTQGLAYALPVSRSWFAGRRLLASKTAPLGLAGLHPGGVALERVDLAIVREHVKRLGERPGGEGVGRIALVIDRDRRRVQGIAQVGIELGQQRRHQQALVDQGATGERGDREIGDPACACGRLGCLARQVERALVGRGRIGAIGRLPDQGLLDDRARLAGTRTERCFIDWHRAPAKQRQAIAGEAPFDDLARAGALRLILRQEKHAHRQVLDRVADAQPRQRASEEGAGNLGQHTGAVAALAVGADTAAMGHVGDSGEGLGEDGVARLAGKMRNKADPAGIVLEAWVVQATPG